MTNEEILHLRTFQVVQATTTDTGVRRVAHDVYGHRYLTDNGVAHFFTSDEGRDFIHFSFALGQGDTIVETTPMQQRQLTAQWRRFDNANFGASAH